MEHDDIRWLEETGRHSARVLAPAKINLFLGVRNRRPDGYHDLKSLMCPVSLFDTLHIAIAACGIRIRCRHTGVPENETNLAWKAARAFLDLGGFSCGVEIAIEKRIPVAAGLGGGSSDGAAVLLALNHLLARPFDVPTLEKMGANLGADVPFFIRRRLSIATGIGERLYPFPEIPNYHVVLVGFDFEVSTASTYKKLNLALTKCLKIHSNHPLEASGFRIDVHLCNDLEQVTLTEFSDILEAKQALIHHGARGALMSGSGPTVFGLFTDPRKAAEAAHMLSRRNGWTTYEVETIH